MTQLADLRVVTAPQLAPEPRRLLRPGEWTECEDGQLHRLPQCYLEVPSWAAARETRLSPHFGLSEILVVDCREHDVLLHTWPHYVPCAVLFLAAFLEMFRQKAGASVYLAANGGYLSPAHALASVPGPHVWGCAADIYRVGNTFLDHPDALSKYAKTAAELGPALHVVPEGTDDHLHIDLGYLDWTPAGCAGA